MAAIVDPSSDSDQPEAGIYYIKQLLLDGNEVEVIGPA